MFSALATTRSTFLSRTSPGSFWWTTCRPGRPTMSPRHKTRTGMRSGVYAENSTMRNLVLGLMMFCGIVAAATTQPATQNVERTDKVSKSDDQWKKELTPNQFHILREKGTEPAFGNEFWDNHEKGVYTCAGCGLELFTSDTKFESGTGWPSFFKPAGNERVT